MNKRGRRWAWVLAGLIVWWSVTGLTNAATPPPLLLPSGEETPAIETEGPAIARAFDAATAAAGLAQSARTPDQWSAVATEWAAAIQALQSVPADSPQRIFAQRKAREYLENQAIAQRRAEQVGAPAVFPTLGSPILDEQLGIYLSYIATFGPPDVLVIGSSRALQGINPQILQQRLAQQGLESVRVYTFAINGATAQVMSFVLRRLLTPEQLPRLIVWAGGSRAFNSGRVDRTFASILESPGYAALQAGDRPEMDWMNGEDVVSNAKATPIPISAINGYGFLPVADVFDPQTYYQRFPRVAGRYDSSYQPFELEGLQTVSLRAITASVRELGIPLVFVNLPLSSDYLDETRLAYERQFQQYLQRESQLGGFLLIDLLQLWPNQNQFFADPSHLNQAGAAQIAVQLAENAAIPWNQLAPATETIAEDSGD